MTDTEQPVELDGMELKKYVEFVIREVKSKINKGYRDVRSLHIILLHPSFREVLSANTSDYRIENEELLKR